jgi:DNA-binding NarL/FixJ family response regulator
MPAQILIADDHEVVRRGLRALLSADPDWEICAEAANGREAVERARQLQPDLVILDTSMPELDGLGAARQIRKLLPATEVLILTTKHSENLVREVLEAGARGFSLKSDSGRDLIAAVEALLDHRPSFSPQVSEILLEGYLTGAGRKRGEHPALTAREREIVQLLAEGKSNKEVASILRISVKTAETHRGHIMAKLNLRNLCDLVRYAIRNEIVQA